MIGFKILRTPISNKENWGKTHFHNVMSFTSNKNYKI